MRVGTLVERKAAPVITVDAGDSIGTAVRLLMEHRVGGLPVVSGAGRLTGFISERDIVESVGAFGADVRDIQVSRIMRRAPTCQLDEPLNAAMQRMTRERLRHLVVCEGERVAGILSVGDIVKHRLNELETETGVLRDYVAAQRAV